MKSQHAIYLTLLMLPFSAFAQSTLSEAERLKASQYLESTSNDLAASLKGLSDAQLSFKPDSNRWSIKQCLEHITLAEIGLSQLVRGSLKEPANAAKRQEIKVSDDDVISRLTNRKGKATSPEFLKPSGTFATVEQALSKFSESRMDMVEFVKNSNDDFRNHFGMHPVTGTIDTYQLILLMAAHGKRHTLQIEEIKLHPRFPKI